jgi:hypothetical protein
MRISKRNPIFILVSILTFVVGVLLTPFERPYDFAPENVLVLTTNPWQLLRGFENQDLRGLDEPQKRMVQGAVATLTGKPAENVHRSQFEPTIFRSMSNGEGEKRYVLVELATSRIVPGSCTLRITVFDTAGRILNAREFDTGNRTFVTSMRIGQYGGNEHQLLIVEGQYSLTDHAFTQFYTLTGDRMEQLYLQQDGQLDHKALERANQ